MRIVVTRYQFSLVWCWNDVAASQYLYFVGMRADRNMWAVTMGTIRPNRPPGATEVLWSVDSWLLPQFSGALFTRSLAKASIVSGVLQQFANTRQMQEVLDDISCNDVATRLRDLSGVFKSMEPICLLK